MPTLLGLLPSSDCLSDERTSSPDGPLGSKQPVQAPIVIKLIQKVPMSYAADLGPCTFQSRIVDTFGVTMVTTEEIFANLIHHQSAILFCQSTFCRIICAPLPYLSQLHFVSITFTLTYRIFEFPSSIVVPLKNTRFGRLGGRSRSSRSKTLITVLWSILLWT